MGFYLHQSTFRKNIYNALLSQAGISADKNDPTIFINKVLTWWKILNLNTLHDNPQQAKIRSNDSWLDFIISFDQMALNVAGRKVTI